MQFRNYGKLDWKVSALGFGAMRLPTIGKDISKVDEPQTIRMIRYAIDHGVNYVDSGYFYNGGSSEKVIGKALKDGYREKIKMATKLPAYSIQSEKDLDTIFNEQIARLQIEKVDIYLMHGLNASTWSKIKNLNVLKWAESKMAQGKIGYLGFSFHDSYEAFKDIVDDYDNWTMSQIQYNYIDADRQAGTKGLNYAASKGLAVVIMEPLRGGLLAKTPPVEVARVWEQTPVGNRSRVEWALDWVWNNPGVSTVLSGMSTMEQVVQNVEYAERSGVNKMSNTELAFIDRVKGTYHNLIPIPCSNCRYCCPCPNGVEIPEIFEIYNEVNVFEDPSIGVFRYNTEFGLKREQRADKCLECRECEAKCPQQIQIVDWLKKAHEKLNVKK
jgi:uncharacterized protein